MFGTGINFWAVLVAGLAYWVLGALWYSPAIVGNAWMKAIGKSKEQLQADFSIWKIIGAVIGSLLVAYGMARIMTIAETVVLWDGIMLGLIVAICLFGPPAWINLSFEGRKNSIFFMNFFYNLIGMVIMGVILAVWR